MNDADKKTLEDACMLHDIGKIFIPEEILNKPTLLTKEEKEIKRTVYYDDLGNVYCYCPYTGVKREMTFDGYDKQRETLSYKCPAKAYGIKCKGCEECPVKTKVRIKREINPRVLIKELH